MAIDQQILNYLLGACFTLFGWVLKEMHQSIKQLQKTDEGLAQSIHEMHVLVAGQYVKQEKFDQTISVMFSKLDKIDEKKDTTLSILNAMFSKLDHIKQ